MKCIAEDPALQPVLKSKLVFFTPCKVKEERQVRGLLNSAVTCLRYNPFVALVWVDWPFVSCRQRGPWRPLSLFYFLTEDHLSSPLPADIPRVDGRAV